jgi:biotin carboxyl carrier protein
MEILLLFICIFVSVFLNLTECFVMVPHKKISVRREEESPNCNSIRRSAAIDASFIDNPEKNKMSKPQQEIKMPNFEGKVIQYFKKAGDRVEAGEPILAVESTASGNSGFRINTDIQASKTGYLAARYKLEGDIVNAQSILAVLVPDQASLSSFSMTPKHGSDSEGGSKSWWSAPYEPGRADPFEAKSSLDSSTIDTITSTPVRSETDDANTDDNNFSSQDGESNVRERPLTRSKPFDAPDPRKGRSSVIHDDRQPDWLALSSPSGGSASIRPSVYASRSIPKNQVSLGSSLPSQSTLGSMNLGENSLPKRSTLSPVSISNRQSYSNDNNIERYQSYDSAQASSLSFQRNNPNRIKNSFNRYNLLSQGKFYNKKTTKRRRRPTNYDIVASTVGGSIWGSSLALGTMMAYPAVDLSMPTFVPPVVLGVLFGGLGYVSSKVDNDAGYSICYIFGFGNGLKYQIQNLVSTTQKAVEKSANAALTLVSTGGSEAPMRVNRVTLKTRDIIQAMEFYSLLGFESKDSFYVEDSRATWLDNIVIGAGRLELIEVKTGGTARALDRVRNKDLLGYMSLTLDVTDLINQNGIPSLSEFLGYLNEKSFGLFGKGLRLAIEPQTRAIGDQVYDIASLYDPDGSLIEIQYQIPERRMPMDHGSLMMINRRQTSGWEDESFVGDN